MLTGQVSRAQRILQGVTSSEVQGEATQCQLPEGEGDPLRLMERVRGAPFTAIQNLYNIYIYVWWFLTDCWWFFADFVGFWWLWWWLMKKATGEVWKNVKNKWRIWWIRVHGSHLPTFNLLAYWDISILGAQLFVRSQACIPERCFGVRRYRDLTQNNLHIIYIYIYSCRLPVTQIKFILITRSSL